MTWPLILLFPLIFVGLAVLAGWGFVRWQVGRRG